jgi:hypothetical protein
MRKTPVTEATGVSFRAARSVLAQKSGAVCECVASAKLSETLIECRRNADRIGSLP